MQVESTKKSPGTFSGSRSAILAMVRNYDAPPRWRVQVVGAAGVSTIRVSEWDQEGRSAVARSTSLTHPLTRMVLTSTDADGTDWRCLLRLILAPLTFPSSRIRNHPRGIHSHKTVRPWAHSFRFCPYVRRAGSATNARGYRRSDVFGKGSRGRSGGEAHGRRQGCERQCGERTALDLFCW